MTRMIIRASCVAVAAASLAFPASVWAQDSSLVVTRAAARGWQPAPAANFTGTARVQPAFESTTAARAYGASVAFEPGARTHWHVHPRGQVLVITAGAGRVQRWGGPIEEVRTGDVIRIGAGVKHWHGATPTSAMSHLAIVEPLGGRGVTWLEPVTDAQYGAGANTPAAATPSRAQQLMGDIAPKLAQLTDSVLFGEVWSRPGLSPRDRSLVTVSALIAMNRPDQLRSHLALARQNGVTRDEAVEAVTHLAFYAGWPSAVSAVALVREVYTESPR